VELTITGKHVMQIPDLEFAPMGVAEQLGVSETGEFVEKLRITHNLSFSRRMAGLFRIQRR